MDAVITLQQYAQYIQKTGNKIAITQHGNLCSAGQMIASKNNNWILGSEVYFVDSYSDQDKGTSYHLLLLCKNKKGWQNLTKINNIACQNFYKRPIVTIQDIKKHQQGLVVCTACQGNKLARLVSEDNLQAARGLVREWKRSFDHFYLQLQYGTSQVRPKINQAFIKFHQQQDVPLIVTNDVHLLRQQDQLSKQILGFISYGKKKDFSGYAKLWLCDRQQILSRVPQRQKEIVQKAMRNTVQIAYDLIQPDLITSIDTSIKLPAVDTKGMVKEAIQKLQSLGFQKQKFDKYVRRLKYQLQVIDRVGVMGYFRVVQQAVKLAQDNNIYVGAGRGSAAGSLFSYLLGITSIDPIKYNLMFQRFLNPSLVIKSADDLPDIDLDFQDPDKLRQLLRKKYGQVNVAQGRTFSTYSPKLLLKDILRYYDVPFQRANRATKLFDIIMNDIQKNAQDKAPDFSLPVIRQYDQFNTVFKQYPFALKPFQTLYKRRRHIGRHAAAVVYLDQLSSKIPQYRSKGQVITAWGQAGGHLKTLSKNGFVKFDFLGLKTLRVIHRTVDLIKKNYDITIDYKKINVDDPRVYDNTFNRSKFTGIFQFSSKGMRTLCKQVKPRCINDISAIVSLFRPACLKSKFHQHYLQNKQKGQPQYIHPKIRQILSPTYGTIIYQQQVFQLVKAIGGYSDIDVSLFKKYMLKVGAAKKFKDYKQQVNIFKVKFLTNATQKLKLNKIQVSYLYDQIVRFAAYGFCLAHARSYSVTSVWCAWFLHYYPSQWLSSLINQDRQSFLPQIVKQYKKHLLTLDMLKSGIQTTTQLTQNNYKIRLGLNIIKGLGQKVLTRYIQKRQGIRDPEDFIFGFSKTITQKLVLSGACDSLQPNRKRLLMAVIKANQKGKDKLKKKQFSEAWVRLQKVKPYKIDQLYDLQMKIFGMNIFVNVWQTYKNVIKKFIRKGKAVLDFSNFKKFKLNIAYVPINISDVKIRNQKNNKKMAFVKFVTPTGEMQQVPIFANTWQFLSKKIKPDFSVYFGLFTYQPEKKSFMLGDGSWQCNQQKANSCLLNLKYIMQKQEVTNGN